MRKMALFGKMMLVLLGVLLVVSPSWAGVKAEIGETTNSSGRRKAEWRIACHHCHSKDLTDGFWISQIFCTFNMLDSSMCKLDNDKTELRNPLVFRWVLSVSSALSAIHLAFSLTFAKGEGLGGGERRKFPFFDEGFSGAALYSEYFWRTALGQGADCVSGENGMVFGN